MVYGPNDAACYHEAPAGTKAARRLEADRGECAIQRPRVVRFPANGAAASHGPTI